MFLGTVGRNQYLLNPPRNARMYWIERLGLTSDDCKDSRKKQTYSRSRVSNTSNKLDIRVCSKHLGYKETRGPFPYIVRHFGTRLSVYKVRATLIYHLNSSLKLRDAIDATCECYGSRFLWVTWAGGGGGWATDSSKLPHHIDHFINE